MHRVIKGELGSVIGKRNYDIVILMNNSNGSWCDVNALSLKHIFPDSYKKETATASKQNSLLGTYELPVNEPAVGSLFLNVRTRLMDSNISKRCEVEVLEHALRNITSMWFNKRVLLIPYASTNLNKLKSFADKKLAGNKVSIYKR